MKNLGICLLLFLSVTAHAEFVPKQGIWYGTIGDHNVMLCVEAGRAAYYYAGQSSEISLVVRNYAWSESVRGATTGHWTTDAQGKSNSNPDRLDGVWRNARGKNAQPISLWHLADDASACSSATYQQTLLIPGDAKLDLALPRARRVAASGASAAVIRANGDVWMWSEVQTQPKWVASGYVKIAVGPLHTLGIKVDGSLWGWGNNAYGQLGGDNVPDGRPVHMGDGFVSIAANGSWSLAVRKDGTLWAWGGLSSDAKGNVIGRRKDNPTLLGKSFVSVSAGDASFAAIKGDGTLWAWGQNHDGQLGIGNGGSRFNRLYKYEQLPTLVGDNFVQVSMGYSHAAAIKKDGTLWSWGHGSWGKLGNGSDKVGSPAPIKIGDDFSWVVAGYLNTAAIKQDGTLWLWGGNQLGIFGDCTTKIHDKPTEIGTDAVEAALGEGFLLVAKADGSQWTWGWPWDGDQLNTPRACRKPTQVVFGDGTIKWEKAATGTLRLGLAAPRMPSNVISIAVGGSHSAMVTADGGLWTWGNNEYGQLALGTTENHNTPQLAGSGYERVYIDAQYTLALKQDRSFWRWGAIPAYYPRGDFLKQKKVALAPVRVFAGTTHLLRSGYQAGRGLGLRADGTILDWGYYGETSKQPVEFGRDVTEISAQSFDAYAIKKDGSLWQLSQYPISPPPRHVGSNFIHVVSNVDHTYGIKADGTLWAWGANAMHQLGDGTQIGRADPVQIGSGFVQVAAGRFHGIALAADGSLWTWGNNEVGVVGDGSPTTQTKPTKIGTGFAQIAAGDYHNLALKSDGTLWTWGNNEDGQLGDGTNARRLSPVQIGIPGQGQSPAKPSPTAPTRSDAKGRAINSIRTGLYYSCAFFADDRIKCWGSNSEGQLGNDRRLDSNPRPIVVERKDGVLSRLDHGASRMINCGSNACEKTWSRYPFLRGAAAIVDDFDMHCGLMRSGKIRCSYGDDGGSSRFVVDGVDDAVMFDYSGGHGCALQADGRAKCWGDNSHGQLGNGTTITNYGSYPSVATQVIGLESE